MKIERQNNEILVRFPIGTRSSKIQSILDYLRYEELTSKSTVNQNDINKLINEAKEGRWEKNKKKLKLDD